MSRRRIHEMLAETGLDPVESTDIVDALAPMADLAHQAPAPSAELATLFARTPPVGRPTSLSGRSRSTLAGVVVLALSGVGATGLSAAANTLPGPFQHQVSEFSRHYLPFDLPEPPGRTSRPAVDAGSPDRSDGVERDTGATATRSIPGRVDGHPAGGSGTSGSEAEWPGYQGSAGSRPEPNAGQGAAPGSKASDNHSPSAESAESDESLSLSGSATTEKSGHHKSAQDRSAQDRSDDERSDDEKSGKDRDRASGKNHDKHQGKGHDKQQDKDRGNDKGSGPSPEPGNGPGEGHEDDGGGREETPPAPPPDTPEPDLPLPDVVPGNVAGGGPTPGG